MIRFGVQAWGTDFAALIDYCLECERLGYTSVRYGDGLWNWTLEGWSVLAAIAARTRTLRIGPAVTYIIGDAYRHPSLLAKTAATVDIISGGRLDLRLGVGATDEETAQWWESFGISYPRPGIRIEQLREGIKIIKALWTNDQATFDGRHFHLKEARFGPLPLQTPHPPIWVSAMNERALRIVAELADGWEASYLSPEAFRQKANLLKEMCRAVGRDFAALQRSLEVDVVIERSGATRNIDQFLNSRGITREHPLVETALLGDGDACREKIGQFVEAGVTEFTLSFSDYPGKEMLRLFAETVLARLRNGL